MIFYRIHLKILSTLAQVYDIYININSECMIQQE